MIAMDTSHDPYDQIAELYDLEHQNYDEDVEYYGSFIEAAGDPVLELGCGSGRLLLPIAQAGFRVTGLDRSKAMLGRARQLLERNALSDRVQLFENAMTQAEEAPGGPFGIAILALNSLMHLTSQDEQRTCLQSAFRSLDPRGQLLIDVMNPTPEALRGLDHALSHQGSWETADGGRVDRFTATKVRPALQLIETDLWYDSTSRDGSLRRVHSSFGMRYLHLAELELLLNLSGFAEWQVYGSYDLDPFTDHSDRIIVAAEVTKTR
jgi:SAM-dependent methyltransferase